ncbi:MAG: sigma-70 family RNA polymerase sigma factor [Salinivirgaceae bacterium]|nr:sigma-70 family RNA polymerase sigma factor [Salinivirgaceae bacterium]
MSDLLKDLESLITACKRGKPDAQRKLYEHFSGKMFGVCLQYSKDYTEAEDIMQDGFIKVFTKIAQFNFNGSFEGWVRRIMVNCALERFRKQNMLYTVSDIQDYDYKLASEDALAEISSKELLNLIQKLSPQYKTVFNLYAIEGYSHQEIGEMLKISVGTSKSNLSRARVILQDKVKLLYKERKKDVKLVVK